MNKYPHIVIVEAYEGLVEFLSDEPEKIKAARGLGLPIQEIAEQLDCNVTILAWDDWWNYEARRLRVTSPATQPIESPAFNHSSVNFSSNRVKRVQVPTIDPVHEMPFELGLSPRSHGLINDNGLLFFASYCLNKTLQSLFLSNPFQAVIVPMWSGIGYVAQMAKATQASSRVDVPIGLVVTDTALNRQTVNQEGIWTRHNIIRRQMEDISLALADLVLAFGSRGKEIAIKGRLPEASLPVIAPRHLEPAVLDAITTMAQWDNSSSKPSQLFLYEPQHGASGVITTLDAVNQLFNQGTQLERPFVSSGSPMVFAPMKPRDFVHYWSSRGFAQELIRKNQWKWQRNYPNVSECFPIRVFPNHFEHLPNIWAELAIGSLVLLSPAAAEGLAPGEVLPQEIMIDGEPTPDSIANLFERVTKLGLKQLDQIRRDLCTQVLRAQRSEERDRLLKETVAAIRNLWISPPTPQDLSKVALLFGDRRQPLQVLAQQAQQPIQPQPQPQTKLGTLSVVVTCYEMGDMLKEALISLWESKHQPDEVLVIDDGSSGEETLLTIQELKQIASTKGLPLQVIRRNNGGLAAARNTGLEAATGEFISFLDGDDLIEPEFFQLALNLLKQYPSLGGIAAWATLFGDHISDGLWNAPQPELPLLFLENNVIVPCVTRTDLLRHLGGYDTRQRFNYEDWELAIRMVASGWFIVTIPMNLMKYRVRQDSLFRSMTDIQNQVMRELLLNTHREVVSKFAIEITMLLEHQWKQLAYSDQLSINQNTSIQQSISQGATPFNLIQKVMWIAQKALSR